MTTGGRAAWHAAVLVLAAASLTSFLALRHGVRSLGSWPAAFDADACFADLRQHLGGTREVAYLTDRDESSGRSRLYGAQYTLLPVVIRRKPNRRQILEGCTLIADFADASQLDARFVGISLLCDSFDVEIQVTRVSPTLCLVRTRPR